MQLGIDNELEWHTLHDYQLYAQSLDLAPGLNLKCNSEYSYGSYAHSSHSIEPALSKDACNWKSVKDLIQRAQFHDYLMSQCIIAWQQPVEVWEEE